MRNSILLSFLIGCTLTVPVVSWSTTPGYSAELTLASSSPSVGGTDPATLNLTNGGTTAANAGLTINLPSGFSGSNPTPACGGQLTQGDAANQLVLTGASIPAGGSCTFHFTLNVPPVASMPPANQRAITIVPRASAGLAPLSSSSVPTIQSILGSTPGLYSNTWFPKSVTSVALLDLFITPETDPGPNSNVYWSNQINSLGGYTGMQSTELVSSTEGYGKQFLFSLWGATDAKPGTPSSAGIGAGSFCTVSKTATDGAAGAQCRYRYEWQAGHTYRFRITPNTALGAGWYKSNVTDMTAGSSGDSFDIGSIYVGNGKTDVPVTSIGQWVEYWDWNSSRTSCSSVAYSHAKFSIQAFDKLGNAISVPRPTVSANSSCPDNYYDVSASATESTLIGGPQQSAAGLFKTNGRCLTAQAGLTDGSPIGTNNALLGTCPTLDAVRKSGGIAFNSSLWVSAGDGTIQTKSSYCLTAAYTGANGNVVLATCVPNARNQQWSVVHASSASAGAQIVAKQSGLCLTPLPNGTLTMQTCGVANSGWTTPRKTFAY
ncbi:RICIN domain-containing protein [Burkholderia stagnalis]|uniref:DUF3472 domain-containing protein n=1 Tax=Burkholderia stagnalis TaxID=1503054 RepID=A0ABX9YBW4_9BURK|nr:DUF3472 domain-containing protein [Burkholderia stagnalis]RQQ43786.1 DUF3472 domain-containing protein [Burkholderia stagnalis]RQQ58990.1 DUF3472 domain-containing protein [Burkholderia stagnalis]RQQ59211.1 DUF3472 domain-containing protein [Burkholderia stagnalis]RQQ72930.1 DUF3472 domain-containing protein [Burkholderia stagnalis]RQQ77509.1 DUF3472 domain-containing protein [Burkholderia stagnalis]